MLQETGQKLHRGRADVAVNAVVKAAEAPPEQVLVSNVAGARFTTGIVSASRERWGVEPTFVQVSQQALGVRCGYQESSRLGVDRWIAVLAAHRSERDSVCVVDAGTALTIDVVTANGEHLGGIIIPGRRLMARALDRDTSDIGAVQAATAARDRRMLGTSTDEAVEQGAWVALAGAVELIRRQLELSLGSAPTLLVTGGDGEELIGWLSPPTQHRPHLVLEGLALLADKDGDSRGGANS